MASSSVNVSSPSPYCCCQFHLRLHAVPFGHAVVTFVLPIADRSVFHWCRLGRSVRDICVIGCKLLLINILMSFNGRTLMLISNIAPRATVIDDQLVRLCHPLISCCYYSVCLSRVYYPDSHRMDPLART